MVQDKTGDSTSIKVCRYSRDFSVFIPKTTVYLLIPPRPDDKFLPTSVFQENLFLWLDWRLTPLRSNHHLVLPRCLKVCPTVVYLPVSPFEVFPPFERKVRTRLTFDFTVREWTLLLSPDWLFLFFSLFANPNSNPVILLRTRSSRGPTTPDMSKKSMENSVWVYTASLVDDTLTIVVTSSREVRQVHLYAQDVVSHFPSSSSFEREGLNVFSSTVQIFPVPLRLSISHSLCRTKDHMKYALRRTTETLSQE